MSHRDDEDSATLSKIARLDPGLEDMETEPMNLKNGSDTDTENTSDAETEDPRERDFDFSDPDDYLEDFDFEGGEDFNKPKIKPVQHLTIQRLSISPTEKESIGNVDRWIKNYMEIYNKKHKSHEYHLQYYSGEKRWKEVDESDDSSTDYNIQTWLNKFSFKSPILDQLDYPTQSTSVLHLLLFFYRRGELFALTTGSAWQVVQNAADFMFPPKIAARILTIDGQIFSKNRKLIGNSTQKTNVYKKAQLQNWFSIGEMNLNFKTNLRENASLYDVLPPSYKSKSKRLIVQMGVSSIRFLHRFAMQDYHPILNHLVKISSGQPTYDSAKGEIEKETKVHAQNLQVVPRSKCDELTQALCRKLAESIATKNMSMLVNFDIGHSKAEDYYLATKFKLMQKSNKKRCHSETIESWTQPPSCEQIWKELAQMNVFTNPLLSAPNFHQFKKLLDRFELKFQPNNSKTMSSVKLLRAINGDMYYEKDDRVYWKSDLNWCSVSRDHLAIVHKKFLSLLKNDFIEDGDPAYLSLPWPKKSDKGNNKSGKGKSAPSAASSSSGTSTGCGDSSGDGPMRDFVEAKYNKLYAKEKNFIVGDTILESSIELFDLLYYDKEKNSTYIYHVKAGFGQKTREACSQILNSFSMIRQYFRGGSEPFQNLEKYYSKLNEYMIKAGGVMPEFANDLQKFKGLLSNRNLVFVYGVVLDTKKKTLAQERGKKALVSLNDLEMYVSQFEKIECENLASEFGIDGSDSNLAGIIFKKLVENQYVDEDGQPMSKLICSTQENFKLPNLKKSENLTIRKMLEPYTSVNASLIARLDLLRVKRELNGEGYDFKICEIMREKN